MTRARYNSSFDDLEELRKRFEDFRSQHQTRTRLPEEIRCWLGLDHSETDPRGLAQEPRASYLYLLAFSCNATRQAPLTPAPDL